MLAAVYVFIGGGLGSLCRYGLAVGFTYTQFSFLPPPRATLFANIISCLILGFLIGWNEKVILEERSRLLLMTGFCGGFSTFSTFSGELVKLYQDGQAVQSIVYLLLSILTGVLCIIMGAFLAKGIA